MLVAVVNVHADVPSVVVVDASMPRAEDGDEAEAELAESEIIPIAPEVKEMAWGFGSFAVLALLMRYVLYPRLRRGMDARYGIIKGGHDEADRVMESAQADVATYEAQLAAVRAEAQQRIEAARNVLDGERSERLSDVNARIAERRGAAATEVEQARAAAQRDVEQAVRAVATRAGELALGRSPDPQVVSSVVADVMGAGANR